MDHNKSRLYRTFLVLMQLEDRMQPGTLLTTGIDAAMVADAIEKPQTSDRVIKRIKASEDIQIVSGLNEPQPLVSSPTTSHHALSTNQSQQITETALNPSILTPARAEAGEIINVGGREIHKLAPVHERAPDRIVTPVNWAQTGTGKAENRIVSSGVDTFGNSEGGGTRAHVWAHYDTTPPSGLNPHGGSDRSDRVNDTKVYNVAGPCFDHTLTAGVIGRNGTIRIYAPGGGGALVAQLNVALVPALRTELKAIAVAPSGVIYGVGSYRTALAPAGTLINNFIAQWPTPTCAGPVPVSVSDPAVNGVVYPAASGVLALNDIDFQLGAFGGFEVSAVGSIDSASTTSSDIFIANNTATLTSPMDFTIGFGGILHSQGLSISMDDGTATSVIACDPDAIVNDPVGILGTRYIGAQFDSTTLGATGGASPMNLNFYPDFAPNNCDYASYWGGGATNFRSTYPDPETGFFGNKQDGAINYLSGGTEFKAGSAFQSGLDTSAILYVDTYTGGVYLGGAFYGITAGNYYSKRNAVAPGGALSYSAGSINSYGVASLISEGDATEYDAFGTPISFQTSACLALGPDEDTDGAAVAVHAGGDVSVGGRTDAPSADWAAGGCPDMSVAQPLSSVDSTFGGANGPQITNGGPPSDGYVYRMNPPLGSGDNRPTLDGELVVG